MSLVVGHFTLMSKNRQNDTAPVMEWGSETMWRALLNLSHHFVHHHIHEPTLGGFGLFSEGTPFCHHWDEMKSLTGLSGQHIQPSPRWTTASCRPPGSPPTSSPPAPALAVKSRLPARGGWRLPVESPRTLRESPSISQHHSYLNGAWGLSGKYKTGGTASSFMLHTLSWEKCFSLTWQIV